MLDEMVMKWGRERFYISSNYFCATSFLVKILLVKLKYLCIQYAWISTIEKWNSNLNVNVEKMVVFVKTFDHYHHKLKFDNFFSCPVKLWKNLKMKFRSKFDHGFTNHGCMHRAVWKALYKFKIKRAKEARYNQFLFQNVHNNEIFEIFKMFKNSSWINVYYTNSKRSWTACSVFHWNYPFWVNLVQKLKFSV